jgi:Transposase
MYVCILDAAGQVLVHRNVTSTPEAFLEIVAPYRDDLVVAAECMFTWYWLADVCAAEGLTFVLGHALAMKAIHGGKSKNDKIDSHKIASLLRGGLLPQVLRLSGIVKLTRNGLTSPQEIAIGPHCEPDKLCRGLEIVPQLDNA